MLSSGTEPIDIKPIISPPFLEFPLSVLEEAFGNCEVNLSRCDNDPRLRRNTPTERSIEPFLSAEPGNFVTISFKNNQYADFTLILMRENVIEEGWSHVNGNHVYYANFSENVQVHPFPVSKEDENPEPITAVANKFAKYKKLKNGQFECLLCRNTFSCWSNLRKHVSKERCPSMKSYQVNGEEKPAVKQAILRRVSCNFCGTTFSERSNLSRHINKGRCPAMKSEDSIESIHAKSDNFEQKSLPKKPEPESLKLANNTRKRYECTKCDKDFSKMFGLKRHIETIHTGTKNFKCALCGLRFSRKESLKYHMAKPHHKETKLPARSTSGFKARIHTQRKRKIKMQVCTGQKSFACSICDSKFTRSEGLARHIRNHSGKPRFKCRFCDMMFFFAHHLSRHRSEIHAGELPFHCSVCNLGVKDSWYLKKHMMRCHPNLVQTE